MTMHKFLNRKHFFLTVVVFLASLLVFPEAALAGRKKKLKLKLEEGQELINGCWKIVETNTLGSDLDMETIYLFCFKDSTCKKKNNFNGYVEETKGIYSVWKDKKEFYIAIDFETKSREEFQLTFESRDRIILKTVVDQTTLIYTLERQPEPEKES